MSRDEFIKYFLGIMKKVYKKRLPLKTTENEFIERAYELNCIQLAHIKKVRHIKTGE